MGLLIPAFNLSISAQNKSLGNQQIKEITILQDSSYHLDSLSIVPGSENINVDGQQLSIENYYIQNNTLIFKEHIINELNNKKVYISYRTFDFNIESKYQHLDSSMMESVIDRIVYIGYDHEPYAKAGARSKLFSSEDLNYDGSFTRGFSVGNSQSLVLNSNFSLQMSGDLGDNMTIEAAISDDNLPIQAEGNTQLLQEFDQVYMRINKNNTSIVAGDYQSGRPNSYFMNYFKKLKGLSVANKEEITEKYTVSSRGNYAVARGKFSRNLIGTQEGNQGPYRLVGTEGERLVKVLSGTEKVYLDGRLLTRGFDHDYVISYDRAEINFTPRILITKDSRIIIEFEYADQNYLRTQYGTGVDLTSDKVRLSFNLYSEQDSKTATGDIDLDSLDLAILTEVGDDFDNSFRSGIRDFSAEELEFEPILYRQVWEESIRDSILVYTPDASLARYTASFSEVGVGNGSYRIDSQAAANGRAYKWVGQNNGQYEPVIRLIAPEKRQLITLGGSYLLAEKSSISSELAFSDFDLNRFSTNGNNDNSGIAGTLGFDHESYLGKKEKKITLETSGGLEIVNKDFNSLNPYRNAEFVRDWNIDSADDRRVERISKFSVGVNNDDKIYGRYSFQNFNRQELFQGSKNLFEVGLKKGGWNIEGIGNFLSTESLTEQTTFKRPIIKISKQFAKLKNWTVGMHYELEENKRTFIGDTNLNIASFKYDYIKTYLQSPKHEKFNFRIGYNQRRDHIPDGERFLQSTLAKEFQVSGKWQHGDNSRLVGDLIMRDLSVSDTQPTNITPKRTYLGRIDYDFSALNKAIRSNTSYQVGSGQQAKAEYEYLMVQKGTGQYIWLDDGDGVQETFEFQISPVQDTADYIKIAIYNNEFVKTNDNSLNQNLRLEGRNLFNPESLSKSKTKKLISKVSALLNVRINKKTEESGGGSSFSPFNLSLQDSSLITYNSAINNTLFFNRGNPVFDIQVGNRKNTTRFTQVSGAEQSKLTENFTRIRWGLNRATDVILNVTEGSRSQTYDLFLDNSYVFDYYNLNPEINFRPRKNIRLILNYIFQNKKSKTNDKAMSNEFSGELTWRQANKTNLTTGLGFIAVKYDGQANPNLELAMLDGLRAGKNYLWNLGLTRRMANNIDLIISYDGRRTGASRTIHTGRAQVKATF